MLIKNKDCAFVGLINAVILSLPLWAVIAFVYIMVTKFEIIAEFSLTVG